MQKTNNNNQVLEMWLTADGQWSVCDGRSDHSMTAWMALFGLVWLLRVRGSLCGCAACKRARQDPYDMHEHEASHELHEASRSLHEASRGLHEAVACESPREECAAFDVIALQQFTKDATVQTDFDDDEDLDKIELQITEECKYIYCTLLLFYIQF